MDMTKISKILHLKQEFDRIVLQHSFMGLPVSPETISIDMIKMLTKTLKNSNIKYEYYRKNDWVVIHGGCQDFPSISILFDRKLYYVSISRVAHFRTYGKLDISIPFCEMRPFFLKLLRYNIITSRGLSMVKFQHPLFDVNKNKRKKKKEKCAIV